MFKPTSSTVLILYSSHCTCSLSPRLSPQNRGGESLVTFARKAVDFRRVIIHVINEGHAYFCGKCREFNTNQSRALLKISLFIFKASPASPKSETLLQLTRTAHLVNRRSSSGDKQRTHRSGKQTAVNSKIKPVALSHTLSTAFRQPLRGTLSRSVHL